MTGMPAAIRPLSKRLERRVGQACLMVFVPAIRALPLPFARSLGRGIGKVLYGILGRRRRVALRNLQLVYGGEMDEKTRRSIARAVFCHFGEIGAEFLKLPQLPRTRVDSMAQVVGEEHLRQALSAGKGVLLITGHFGNWEFLARWLATHDYTLNVVARHANDPVANRLLDVTRSRAGTQVYNRGNSARAVLQSLRRNEIVGLLPDQNAGEVFVPFLGHTTGTVDGPAVIHLRTGSPLLFAWCTREPDGGYRILFEPPVVVEPSQDRTADILATTTLINQRLEMQIRARPAQWLWLHDRWKSSPGVFHASGR